MRYFTFDRSAQGKHVKYYVTSKLSENIHETPEGFLVCIGVPIARTGEMIYGENETPLECGDDGHIVITRDEADVFHPDCMASFEGKAVTITHPSEFVSPQNWSRLAKGLIQNVRRGEGEEINDLLADLLITDSVAINLVKSGLREVSCGYEADYTQIEEGKGKQSNIIGNHLALVDEGRAGSSYAINDHKGKGTRIMKIKEVKDKVKAIFAKANDEAMKAVEDAGAGDEKPAEGEKEKAKDAGVYDELVSMVKDLGEKVAALGAKPKDEKPVVKKDDAPEGEEKAKDDAPAAATSLEDRLSALEAAVSKLLEHKAGEVGDEDAEESEDDDFEESTMTGDAAMDDDIVSRAEILAPGLKKTKDMKVAALKTAYGTKEGKKIIESLNGGKAPTYDSADKVDTLFVAASELLKVMRTRDLARSKVGDGKDGVDVKDNAPMTAEKMNEINAKHYNRK